MNLELVFSGKPRKLYAKTQIKAENLTLRPPTSSKRLMLSYYEMMVQPQPDPFTSLFQPFWGPFIYPQFVGRAEQAFRWLSYESELKATYVS
jgi:hypothetical protein